MVLVVTVRLPLPEPTGAQLTENVRDVIPPAVTVPLCGFAPLNVQFVKTYQEVSSGRNPDFFSIGGYDGMHAIYETLKKTKGNTDAETLIAAAKGLKWESPRGPMMIDPETRDVVQNVYIRRVEKVGGELVNVPFDTIPMVKDPAGERRKQQK